MNDQYLWDRSGPRDIEIARLEHVLGTLQFGSKPVQRRWWPTAIAAALLIGLAGSLFTLGPAPQQTAWRIVDGKTITEGQALRTDSNSKLDLYADEFGRIEMAPNSELRIGRDQLSLPHGSIHVLIWAPPKKFVVDTPSARAIDLGCQYTLSVDPSGDGMLTVETGWVAFQVEGRESFIPAGAACKTRKRTGPGTPYFQDASDLLRTSIHQFDQTGDPTALRRVLTEARQRDALTLWHLLTRAKPADRGDVFAQFAKLVALPKEVTREGIVAKDPHMLDLSWNALKLDDADWWREWKREWRP